jgi:hypothetical protein
MGNGCVTGANNGGAGRNSKATIKVVLSDGTIEEFFKAITVAEVMLDHPQHFVLHSSSTNNPQKKAILPADIELEPGRLYYLLPSIKFSRPLSPPDVETESAVSKVAPVDQELRKQQQQQQGDKTDMVKFEDRDSFGPDVRSMYIANGYQPNLLKCNSWKPRLETINEAGALSRKKFQSFVRRSSLSQVHSYLST